MSRMLGIFPVTVLAGTAVTALCLAVVAPAGATAARDPAVVFNSQVTATAPAPPAGLVDNFPQNKQNEPSITVDPATGALVAGSNDEIDEPLCTGAGTAASPGSCPFVPGVGNSGVYLSSDGGARWTQPAYANQCGKTIHTLPGYCQQGLESFGDPVLAVGPALPSCHLGTGKVVYYGNLAFPAGSAVPVVAVSRSADDGASWLSPVVASSTTNPVDFNDKDYVWADDNPHSPFYGTVYASWTLFQGAGRFGRSGAFSPEPIVVARSTDCGATWSMGMRLSQSANNSAVGRRQGPAIRAGPPVLVSWPAQTWQPAGTPPGPGVGHQIAAFNLLTVGSGWSGAALLSTATGDPDGSSTNSLGAQFLGDYTAAVATNTSGVAVWTDTRNETPCAAVDALRAGTTSIPPNPDTQCPPSGTGQLFGNSDIFAGGVGF